MAFFRMVFFSFNSFSWGYISPKYFEMLIYIDMIIWIEWNLWLEIEPQKDRFERHFAFYCLKEL
jgi:hypothetical protein